MRGGREAKVPRAKKFAYYRNILNKGACENRSIKKGGEERLCDYLASEHNEKRVMGTGMRYPRFASSGIIPTKLASST